MARAMKDSGIEWIGEMPEEWQVKKLKYLGELSASGVDKKIQDGEALYKSVHYMDVYRNSLMEIGDSEDYLVISANDAKALSCALEKGDVLFTNSSETPDDMGHSAVVLEKINDTLFGYHLMRFRPKTKLHLFYEKYMFGSHYMRKWFEYRSTGMTRYGISNRDFSDSLIVIPPIAEQQSIAAYLDRKSNLIDSTIEKQKSVIGKLKLYKQSIIIEALTKGLDPNVKLKPSGIEWIGKIPDGWEIGNIGMFFQIQLGKMLHPQHPDENDTLEYYLGNANIFWDGVRTNVLKQMWFSYQEKDKYLLKKGDLVVTEGGDAGVACLWNNEVENCYIQKALHKVTELGIASNKFLYYWLFALKAVGYIDFICNKATIPHFTKEKFSKSIFILAPLREQQAIADYLDTKCSQIDTIITGKQKLLEKLTAYKKSLIYECVTGKREVV